MPEGTYTSLWIHMRVRSQKPHVYQTVRRYVFLFTTFSPWWGSWTIDLLSLWKTCCQLHVADGWWQDLNEFTGLPTTEPRKKKPSLLIFMKPWLLNRDPYKWICLGILRDPCGCLGIPKLGFVCFFLCFFTDSYPMGWTSTMRKKTHNLGNTFGFVFQAS